MGVSHWLPVDVPVDVPVNPDALEARELLLEELSKQEYQAAKPTWFDLWVESLTDWLGELTIGDAQGPPALGLLLVAIVVGVLLLIAFLVFGLPRINRRSAVAGDLFGDEDVRSAAQMRSAAEAAAAAGNLELAIAEMFRSIARGMAERTVLTTSPGTTARSFGSSAGRAFPAYAPELVDSAAAFDEVRYLGMPGSQSRYERVAALERALRVAKPVLEAVGT